MFRPPNVEIPKWVWNIFTGCWYVFWAWIGLRAWAEWYNDRKVLRRAKALRKISSKMGDLCQTAINAGQFQVAEQILADWDNLYRERKLLLDIAFGAITRREKLMLATDEEVEREAKRRKLA